jgi:FMN phosphatase YigB (HAD superfamily)
VTGPRAASPTGRRVDAVLLDMDGVIRDWQGDATSATELQLAKPDPAIFRRAAAAIGHPPDRWFFADDRAENVDAARAVGMPAGGFTSRS